MKQNKKYNERRISGKLKSKLSMKRRKILIYLILFQKGQFGIFAVREMREHEENKVFNSKKIEFHSPTEL